MKKLMLLIAAIVLLTACASEQAKRHGPADKSATTETVNMLAGLKAATEKGIMFGHQDDLAYGIGWVWPNGESDVRRVASDYPAVYGMDLGHIELDSPVNLDSVPFEDMRTFVKEIWARRGVISFSWHADNPLTDSSAWDISSDRVVASVLPGGENHDKYKAWLDKVAAFFSSLTDEEGVTIPVIFRPYHEHTGSWFWWGQNLCTTDEFVSLWRFTFTYLCEEKNLHNLLFAYSSGSNIRDIEQYLERYPGDDYTDLLGFDYYQAGMNGKESFIREVDRVLGIVTGAASDHGKLPALTETGFEGLADSTWWTGTLWPAIKDHKISYVLVWRNAHNIPGHFFAPYPDQASADDFIEFCNMPSTIFQKELTELDIYK
jgi:mannan endo-1,4-beta-mannosidase